MPLLLDVGTLAVPHPPTDWLALARTARSLERHEDLFQLVAAIVKQEDPAPQWSPELRDLLAAAVDGLVTARLKTMSGLRRAAAQSPDAQAALAAYEAYVLPEANQVTGQILDLLERTLQVSDHHLELVSRRLAGEVYRFFGEYVHEGYKEWAWTYYLEGYERAARAFPASSPILLRFVISLADFEAEVQGDEPAALSRARRTLEQAGEALKGAPPEGGALALINGLQERVQRWSLHFEAGAR